MLVFLINATKIKLQLILMLCIYYNAISDTCTCISFTFSRTICLFLVNENHFTIADSPIKFDFAIFVSGFKSRQKEHAKFYDITIEIPTLHVFGETDKVIAKGNNINISFNDA